MRILVTGATGFIGVHLVRALLQKKYHVRVLVRKKTTDLFPETQFIEECIGDLTTYEDVVRATKDCSCIIHAAALVSFKRSDRSLVEQVNVGGTENIIRAAVQEKVPRVVYVSSAAAIGLPTKEKVLMTEQERFSVKQNEGYPESKWRGEKLVREACNAKNIDAIIVSPSTVYGAGGRQGSTAMLVRSLPGKKIIIAPPGGCSIVTVEDVVSAILLALKQGKTGERYIITGENISYKKLFVRIHHTITRTNPFVVTIPNIFFYPCYYGLYVLESLFGSFFPELMTSQVLYFLFHYRYLDNTKAQKELGWHPKNDFAKAIREMYDVAREH